MCNCNGIQKCGDCIRNRFRWIRENITLYLCGYPINSDTVSPIANPADDEKEKKKQQNLVNEKEKEKKKQQKLVNEKEKEKKQNLAISPDYIWEFFPFFIFCKNVKRIIVIFVKKCKKCKQILEYDFIEL